MILPAQVISYFVSTVVQVSSCLPDLSSRVVAWLAVFSSVGVLGLTETHPCVRRTQAPSFFFNGLDLTYTWAGFVTLSCVFFSASLFFSVLVRSVVSILPSVLSLAVREGRVHSVSLCLVVVAVFPGAYTTHSLALFHRQIRPEDDTSQHRRGECVCCSTCRANVQKSASCVRWNTRHSATTRTNPSTSFAPLPSA